MTYVATAVSTSSASRRKRTWTSNVARPMLFAMWSRLGTTKGSDAERARSRGALPEMPEHHRGGEDHGGGVGAVGAHDVLRDVTTARLEQRVFLHKKRQRGRRAHEKRKAHTTDVAPRDDAGSADEGGANVGHDGAVQVGHDHNAVRVWRRVLDDV